MKNLKTNECEDDTLHEECGVFGVYDFDGADVASTIYYGLFALQHRGQESCGIAVSDTNGPRTVNVHKDMGLVNEVFSKEELEKLHGNIGVGHVRYSTAGSSTRRRVITSAAAANHLFFLRIFHPSSHIDRIVYIRNDRTGIPMISTARKDLRNSLRSFCLELGSSPTTFPVCPFTANIYWPFSQRIVSR